MKTVVKITEKRPEWKTAEPGAVSRETPIRLAYYDPQTGKVHYVEGK